MQRLITRLALLVPPTAKEFLLGRPDAPSWVANAIHRVLNALPGPGFVVLNCGGPLKGYRMKINWRKHRSLIYGTWEPEVVRTMQAVVQEGMVAVDVGAHAGFYTLLLSRLVGDQGMVLAFEPLAPNLRLLRENIELNARRNVRVLDLALLDRAGRLELTVPPATNSLLAGPLTNEKEGDILTAPALPLDDYLAAEGLPVHFIKMDVEGAEELVVKGARRAIETHHPTLLVELHDYNHHGDKHPCVSLLREFGYEVEFVNRWTLTAHVLATWPGKNDAPGAFAGPRPE